MRSPTHQQLINSGNRVLKSIHLLGNTPTTNKMSRVENGIYKLEDQLSKYPQVEVKRRKKIK